MPTPVSVARQCLTPEAAHALDEAVAVARRRGHAQTTSLHAVSALLALAPSSPLRDACARARNSAYSPRLQFKALELCLGVSLDRVSSAAPPAAADPPVSNSLMAAIKRSQANQRRQPESYHLYHHHQLQPQSTVASVKVELQHLTLSILDDPVVSRVFGEAGFRSSEIKMAILRPFSQLLRHSRFRGPPVFLCNLPEYPTRIPFGFFGDVDGNSRRIGEILGRGKGRNPLLVGVCAYDALQSFADSVEKRNDAVLPPALSGLNVVSIEREVSESVDGFREVSQAIERSSGPGIVLNFGDLKAFVSGDGASNAVVGEITRLLEVHGAKVWVIGATASYESYLQFVSRFPSIEKDWDLQLLPITSLRSSSSSSMAESYPRSSLMESFVPFGGFFSAPSDLKFPLGGPFQCPSRSIQCGDNCEQDASDVSKAGFASSVADQCQSSLPSWLQMAAPGANKALDVKTKDDGDLLNAKFPRANLFPTIVGFQSREARRDCSSTDVDASLDETRGMDLNLHAPENAVEKISSSQTSVSPPLVLGNKNESVSSGLCEKASKDEELESCCARSPPRSMSNSSTTERNRGSPASALSVTTDLGLGMSFSSGANEPEKPRDQYRAVLQQDIAQSSSSSSPDNRRSQFDPRDVKALFRAIFERVGWQWEAISVISQAIARCRMGENRSGAVQRRDIWLSFTGPDRSSKKKIASALAEVIYGKPENLICVDLCPRDGTILSEKNGYDVKFRGKNVVDYVAGEMWKKPLAIVFLENVDKSDVLVRKSLSQAISTGKFSDSYGREVTTNNTIFVTTSSTLSKDHSILIPRKESSNYSEERILKAKGRPIRIVIECASTDVGLRGSRIVLDNISSPILLNKRKLIGASESLDHHNSAELAKRAHKASSGPLDLNLPAEENSEGNSETDYASESSEAWLQDFFEKVDKAVIFKPVEFDALAEKIFKEIKDSFRKSIHSRPCLEIEAAVMEQLLAAAYLSDRYKVVEDWIEQVLRKGFEEIKTRHSLSDRSVVKLVSCEGLSLEEQPQTVYLPPRIILN